MNNIILLLVQPYFLVNLYLVSTFKNKMKGGCVSLYIMGQVLVRWIKKFLQQKKVQKICSDADNYIVCMCVSRDERVRVVK